MPYVMVPVPEEHVEDILRFVVRLMSRVSVEPWTEEAMMEFFDEIDEPGRALLSVIARSTLGGRKLTESDAATLIEMNWRETMNILRDVNDRAGAKARPPVVVRGSASETLPNGRAREIRLLLMTDDVVRLVHSADRAQLLAEGSPIEVEQA